MADSGSSGLGRYHGHSIGETVSLRGGVTSINHVFKLPLVWSAGDGDSRTVEVFARELVLSKHKEDTSRPWLLFLQGGPGFPAPRVTSSSGLWGEALSEFRILLLDQRGTGLSSAITHRSLAKGWYRLLEHKRRPSTYLTSGLTRSLKTVKQ
ncbi:unnamed protein product [Choristocarpus tenellus]